MNERKLRSIIEKGLMHKAHAKILERVLEYIEGVSYEKEL